jgi:superfamily I DNA/RNA helicase
MKSDKKKHLTSLQKQIVESRSEKRVIVKAGPGTGKTFCLIERIKFLVNRENLEPETDILVLSFSVAASQEIKKRLQEAVETEAYDDELLSINIRTFDSFASSFMYSINQEIDFTDKGYDERIEMAIEMIDSNDDAVRKLNRYKHIMVDEIQDLVAQRATLTIKILKCNNGGFTIFGDPAQAIYNFLMNENSQGPNSDEFLKQVKLLDDCIEEIVLAENFRALGEERLRRIADDGRKYLLEFSDKKSYTFLRNTFSDLTDLGEINRVMVPEDLKSNNTAFLCRTNGQVFLLAKLFKEQNIQFYIRRPLQDKDIPSWVGRIFFEWKSQKIKKNDFIKTYSSIYPGNNQESEQKLWKELKTLLRVKGSSIRMDQLRRYLIEEDLLSDGAPESNPEEIILSTVHRSKGREFQNVVLLTPEETNPSEYLDEGRVMFVGLTRAQKRLFKIHQKSPGGLRIISDRWVKTMKHNGGEFLCDMEVGLSGDINPHSPVSLIFFDDDIEEMKDSQDDLWNYAKRGTTAKLDFYRMDKKIPIYSVKILIKDEYVAVAETSISFGINLKNISKKIQGSQRIKIPKAIENLWVLDTVTEVGNLGNEDVPRSLRTSGIWIGLRIQGLGTCKEWRVIK